MSTDRLEQYAHDLHLLERLVRRSRELELDDASRSTAPAPNEEAAWLRAWEHPDDADWRALTYNTDQRNTFVRTHIVPRARELVDHCVEFLTLVARTIIDDNDPSEYLRNRIAQRMRDVSVIPQSQTTRRMNTPMVSWSIEHVWKLEPTTAFHERVDALLRDQRFLDEWVDLLHDMGSAFATEDATLTKLDDRYHRWIENTFRARWTILAKRPAPVARSSVTPKRARLDASSEHVWPWIIVDGKLVWRHRREAVGGDAATATTHCGRMLSFSTRAERDLDDPPIDPAAEYRAQWARTPIGPLIPFERSALCYYADPWTPEVALWTPTPIVTHAALTSFTMPEVPAFSADAWVSTVLPWLESMNCTIEPDIVAVKYRRQWRTFSDAAGRPWLHTLADTLRNRVTATDAAAADAFTEYARWQLWCTGHYQSVEPYFPREDHHLPYHFALSNGKRTLSIQFVDDLEIAPIALSFDNTDAYHVADWPKLHAILESLVQVRNLSTYADVPERASPETRADPIAQWIDTHDPSIAAARANTSSWGFRNLQGHFTLSSQHSQSALPQVTDKLRNWATAQNNCVARLRAAELQVHLQWSQPEWTSVFAAASLGRWLRFLLEGDAFHARATAWLQWAVSALPADKLMEPPKKPFASRTPELFDATRELAATDDRFLGPANVSLLSASTCPWDVYAAESGAYQQLAAWTKTRTRYPPTAEPAPTTRAKTFSETLLIPESDSTKVPLWIAHYQKRRPIEWVEAADGYDARHLPASMRGRNFHGVGHNWYCDAYLTHEALLRWATTCGLPAAFSAFVERWYDRARRILHERWTKMAREWARSVVATKLDETARWIESVSWVPLTAWRTLQSRLQWSETDWVEWTHAYENVRPWVAPDVTLFALVIGGVRNEVEMRKWTEVPSMDALGMVGDFDDCADVVRQWATLYNEMRAAETALVTARMECGADLQPAVDMFVQNARHSDTLRTYMHALVDGRSWSVQRWWESSSSVNAMGLLTLHVPEFTQNAALWEVTVYWARLHAALSVLCRDAAFVGALVTMPKHQPLAALEAVVAMRGSELSAPDALVRSLSMATIWEYADSPVRGQLRCLQVVSDALYRIANAERTLLRGCAPEHRDVLESVLAAMHVLVFARETWSTATLVRARRLSASMPIRQLWWVAASATSPANLVVVSYRKKWVAVVPEVVAIAAEDPGEVQQLRDVNPTKTREMMMKRAREVYFPRMGVRGWIQQTRVEKWGAKMKAWFPRWIGVSELPAAQVARAPITEDFYAVLGGTKPIEHVGK